MWRCPKYEQSSKRYDMAGSAGGVREFPVVIVPIRSTEQHGYHLPIGTDVYLAEALAEKTAEKTGALVYPSIHFGYSWSWRDRIGTVTIRQDILGKY